MAHEVEERARLAVLLAHEQERHVRREEDERGREPQAFERHQAREPLAERAVADLIVVLREHDEPVGRHVGRRRTVTLVAERRVRTVVDEAVAKALRDRAHAAEVDVVPAPLAGERGVHGVMEIVRPDAVEAEPALPALAHEPRIVLVALRDDERPAAEPPSEVVNRGRELVEDVPRARVEDRVYGVQAEPVDVILGDPVERVVDHVAAYLVAVGAVVVDGAPPRRAVATREVRAEVGEIVPLGSEVVVDDVQDDGEAAPVRGVDEPLESLGAAVARLGRVEGHAVVAPVAIARELGDGHDLDCGDAQVAQRPQPLDDGVERAGRRERADVQLVEDVVRHLGRAPTVVGPTKRGRVDHTRRAVHAVRLMAAHGIGSRHRAPLRRQAVAVIGARAHALDEAGEDARRDRLERQVDDARAVPDLDAHALDVRRPHLEPDAVVDDRGAATETPRPRDRCAAEIAQDAHVRLPGNLRHT